MKFSFIGSCETVLPGLRALQETLDFQVVEKDSDVTVDVQHTTSGKLTVACKQSQVTIAFTPTNLYEFFRAFGLLLENLRDGVEDFKIIEIPQFKTCGAMYDVSQGNAVINIESCKEFIRRMAIMGLNMLMLYCEDSFTVDKQPYFGYMRGRYHPEDMKELDDYAFQFGIEMIPCIQTLGHLNDALRWYEFSDIAEDDSTLLVGEEKTYAFIEDLILAATKPFRTKRIHIGMDEAWKLGRGQYLTKNGYEPPHTIMVKHLVRVMEIVRKHGLDAMMWSDMFFRALAKDGAYQVDTPLPEGYVDSVPKDVQLVYWDYFFHDEEHWDKNFKIHRMFGEPMFAGAAWTWFSFGINWGVTEKAGHSSLNACKDKGIKEVFMTVWGDCGTECNVFATLPGLSLFAEHFYSETEPSPEKLKKRFEFCTGGVYEDFTSLRYLDETPGTKEGNYELWNSSKLLMWQDILTGLYDANIVGLALNDHYEKWAACYNKAATRNGKFNFLFALKAKVAEVLAIKSELGRAITDAYKNGNREALTHYAKTVLPELHERVKRLRDEHKYSWFYTYKPLGWDVMDIRYGALMIRVQSAWEQINDYLDGKIPCLEELEEKRLLFNSEDGLQMFNYHGYIASPSRFSMTAYF